ncbi:MAG: ABC transporter ATP-binding protein [Caldilineaceae bacterium]
MNTTNDQPIPSPTYFMWRIFAYRPLPQVFSGLCWVFFHTWPLFPGLLAKAFFDLLEGRTTARLNLPTIVVLVLVLALVRIGFVYTDLFVGGVTGFRIRLLLQRNLVARVLERPGAKALPGSVGEALSTLRDDIDTTCGGAGWAFDAVGFLVFAGCGIAILLTVDTRVTLLVFIPIVTVIVLAHVMRTRLQHLRAQSREATARVTGAIGEIFGAVQAIQVAGAEEKVILHLRQLNAERQRAALRDRLLQLALGAVFENTANLGAGLTLLVAASAMQAGRFTVGDFALFSTYLMQVAGMTGFLGYLVTTYQQMGVAFKRTVALLQGAPPLRLVEHHPVYVREPLPELAPVLKQAEDRLDSLAVIGLTLRHAESGRGIENISFTLKRGSFTVITGRIGAGKTTLLRALLGLLETQAGEVYWNGQKVVAPAQFLAPPRVAYTPQTPTLLSGTLRDNILLGLPNADGELQAAIHHAVLGRDLAGFSAGLETVIGARGVRLSGGQIQRTAAARMFVRGGPQGAELLVFDDLSSALDVETEQILWQRVFALETTCLVVSHRRAVLERADQILLLEDGKLTARGKLNELLKTSAEMRRLYQEEVKGDS